MKPLSDQEIISALREVEVPEPSPLFWDHLSQRVRDAVAAEPVASPGWSHRFNVARAGGFIVLLGMVTLAITLSVRHQSRAGRAAAVEHPAVVDAAAVNSALPSLADDASWAVMGELASEIDFEQAGAAGLTVAPGAAEAALNQLSGAEQRSAVELLQQEIKKSRRL
jgi:hypothetical protein